MQEIQGNPVHWWSRGLLAGLIGGVVMGLYMMIAMGASGHGAWMPLNIIGGFFRNLRPPVGSFSLGSSVWGIILHLLTAAVGGFLYATGLAMTSPRAARGWGGEVLLGLVWGVFSWVVMGIGIGALLDYPLIYQIPAGHWFVAHLIYGVVTALALYGMTRRQELSVTFAPELTAVERERARR